MRKKYVCFVFLYIITKIRRIKKILVVLGLFLFGPVVFGQFHICNSSSNKTVNDLWFVNTNMDVVIGDDGEIV